MGGGFDTKNLIFSDLPKQDNGNFFSALATGLDGVGNVELHREKIDKQDKVEAQNTALREAQTKGANQQVSIGDMQINDANALKNLGNYKKYDEFIKDNPLTSVHNIRSAQEFYDAYSQKLDVESSQGIINTLKANNGGKLPTKAQVNDQLPTLIADKNLSNKATGLIYQALDMQEATDLDKLVKGATVAHYQTSDKVAVQNANSEEILRKAQAAAAYAKEPKDALAKEKETYSELVKSGDVKPDVTPFGSWLAQSGGKVTLKSESITNARNKGRDQLSGISSITNEFLTNYNPENHGLFDGAVQWVQEKGPIQTGTSGQLESDRIGLQSAAAAGMFGGKATNQQTTMAKNMIGEALGTQAATAGKIKSVLKQSILNTEETIRQIKSSKGDASDLEEELSKYKVVAKNLEKWDGSTPATPFLDPNYGKNIPKEGTVVSVRSNSAVPQAETNITPQAPVQKKVVRSGIDPTTKRKVVQYDDGSVEYVD